MSEVITGTLHRSKRRRARRNWVRDFADMLAEEAGVKPVRYEKETAYVTGDTMGTTGRPKVWSLCGSLKPFDGIASGAHVKFTASVRHWDNGNGHSLGGDCTRVRDVETLPAEGWS